MNKLRELIDHWIEQKGYKEYDFIIEGKNISNEDPDRTKILVIEIGKIEYPIDKRELKNKAKEYGVTYLILSDEKQTHIFCTLGNIISEIEDLPTSMLKKDEADYHNAQYFLDVLRSVTQNLVNQGYNFHDLIKITYIAIYVDRHELKEELNKYAGKQCKVNELISLIGDDIPEKICNYDTAMPSSQFINYVNCFEHIEFKKPSTTLGRVFHRYVPGYMRDQTHITTEVGEMMGSFTIGTDVEYVSYDPSCFVISSSNKGRSFYRSARDWGMFDTVRYLCKPNSDEVFKEGSTVEDMRDTIVLLPPWGIRTAADEIERDSMFFGNKTDIQYYLVENSLKHLKKGGRLIVLLPKAILFSKGKMVEVLRNFIKEQYKITAIVELKKPLLPMTGIDAVLLIIDNCPPDKCIVSMKPFEVGEYENISRELNEYFKSSKYDEEKYATVDQNSISEIWSDSLLSCTRMYGLSEKEEYCGLSIGSCCEIIRGKQIASVEYFAPGVRTGIPYLRISNIHDGKIDLEDVKRISADHASIMSQEGDIVFTIAGTIGKIALVSDEEFVHSAQMVLLRPKAGYEPAKVLSALGSPMVKKQVNEETSGSCVKHLSVSKLLEIKLGIKQERGVGGKTC